ncbi:hypothetical protein Pcinc_008525 [Petrolisthes cinctipes]|uniref:Globin domain-containing protein n=1 Tax=Petrolisthes cinctipes TaxID=88211 RepID=A0AAE1KWE4_PETCI|nr:hypothetical protein Pcinc_008525 [Petrolisthes cinctipes]
MGNTYARCEDYSATNDERTSRRSSLLRRCSRSLKGSLKRPDDATGEENREGGEEEKGESEGKELGRQDGRENEERSGGNKKKNKGKSKRQGNHDNNDEEEEREVDRKETDLEEGEKEDIPPPTLTQEQKQLIKTTWTLIEASVAKVGVVLFMGLFETHPDVQQVFTPFRGLQMEQVKQSKELRAHALRVMGFVEKAVRRLDQPEKLVRMIQECGRNHCHYGARPDQVQHVVPQFLQAVQPTLGDEWTEDVEVAWSVLLNNLTFIMKEAMVKQLG